MPQFDSDCHILLVEDNPGDARLTQRLIGRLPAPRPSWKLVTTVDDALAELASGSYSVVLTDLDLPDSSGGDTCRRLVAAAGGIPVVLLSGSQNEVSLEQAFRMGVLDFLVKGEFDAGDLHRVLRLAQEYRKHRRLIAHGLSLGYPSLSPDAPGLHANAWHDELAASRELLMTCRTALLHLRKAATAAAGSSFVVHASSSQPAQLADLQRLEQATEVLLEQMAALLHRPKPQPPKI